MVMTSMDAWYLRNDQKRKHSCTLRYGIDQESTRIESRGEETRKQVSRRSEGETVHARAQYLRMMYSAWIIPGLEWIRSVKYLPDEETRVRTCNPRWSRKRRESVFGTLFLARGEERTRRMLMRRSAPHPRSRKTPSGGIKIAKLGEVGCQSAC